MKKQHRCNMWLETVQLFTIFAVAFYWSYYRNVARFILSSEELTLEVMERLATHTNSVNFFQNNASIPVQQFLGGYMIQLVIQIVIMWAFRRWRVKLKRPFVTSLCIMFFMWTIAAGPLLCLMCQHTKLLLTSIVSYIVPYVFSCAFIPALWFIFEFVASKK